MHLGKGSIKRPPKIALNHYQRISEGSVERNNIQYVVYYKSLCCIVKNKQKTSDTSSFS